MNCFAASCCFLDVYGFEKSDVLGCVDALLLTTSKLQGGFDPSKKSGVGVDFELLVRSLQVRNKGAAQKPSMIFS